MSIFDDLTIEDFKNQFPRFSPMYLTDAMYSVIKPYYKNNVVYFNDNFYICIVDTTNTDPTDTDSWRLYDDSVLNYTQDSDILNAYNEAKVNFNESLFAKKETALMVFLYLTAHYLTVDFNNAIGANNVGIPTSKSVGSVSEGYTIPKWLMDNAQLSVYSSTGYGIKYASLIKPYLIGNVMIFKGGPTVA